MGAAMTILYHWKKEGEYKSKQKKGSFERWCEIIGGILEFAGFSSFNSDTGQADDKEDAFKEFIRIVYEAKGAEKWRSRDVFQIAFGTEIDNPDETLPDQIFDPLLEDHILYKDKSIGLGRFIKERVGRHYTFSDYSLQLMRHPQKTPAHFVLIPQENQDGTG